MDKIKNNRPGLHKVLLMIVSLIASFMLWMYVTNQEGSVQEAVYPGVKVVFEGENNMRDNRGLIITSNDTTSVRVTVSGSPRVLARIDAADISAVIDLSSITKTGNYSLSPKITFASGIDSSDLQSKVNVTVNFYVDRLSTTTIPVNGIFNGSTAEGFSAEALQFEPQYIKISGPESDLKTVYEAWVEVSRENVDSTLTYASSYVLRDSEGNVIDNDSIELESDTVNVTLPVIAIKEVDLIASLIPGAGANDQNTTVRITPEKITLSGDADVLEALNHILLDTIDLADITGESWTKTYSIVIPNGTEIVGGAKEATVSVEIKGLQTKTITIPFENLSYINMTDGYVGQIMEEALRNVVLRGTSDALAGLSAVNVRAVADLTEWGSATGIVNVPVKIIVDGVPEGSIGALGDYKIYINITVAPPDNEE